MTKEQALKTTSNATPDGIHVYLGTTGIGKTYKALEDLRGLHRKGWRCVVIDSARVENFSKLERCETLEAVVRRTWGGGKPCFVAWTPEDTDEFDAFMQAALETGDVAILVDEVSFWSGKNGTRILPKLCRVWRHSRVRLLITCQHVGSDLTQTLLACNPRIFIFRCTAPRSLEWVEKWHGIPLAEARAIPDRTYLEKTM